MSQPIKKYKHVLAKQWLPSASITRACVIFMSLSCLRKPLKQENQILKCSRLCTIGSIIRLQNSARRAYITSFTEGRMSWTYSKYLGLSQIISGDCPNLGFYRVSLRKYVNCKLYLLYACFEQRVVAEPPSHTQFLQSGPPGTAFGVWWNKSKQLLFTLWVESPYKVVSANTLSLELGSLNNWQAS